MSCDVLLLCVGGLREVMILGRRLIWKSTISIHRGNLQALLVEAAKEAGAKIEVDSKVVGIDESGPSPVAVTKDGRRIEADLIIGADGKSLPHLKTKH